MDPRHDNNGFQMPQMPAPPTVFNPPPQIFGAYAADGLPNMSMPDLSQPLFADTTLMDESIEAKRRRIARVGRLRLMHCDRVADYVQACDMCRKKKIKCDGKLPECTHCVNYKTQCVFTQVEKKRNPPKGYLDPNRESTTMSVY